MHRGWSMYISQGQCPDIRYLVQAGLIHMVCVSVCSSGIHHRVYV